MTSRGFSIVITTIVGTITTRGGITIIITGGGITIEDIIITTIITIAGTTTTITDKLAPPIGPSGIGGLPTRET
jgi:hypothetical protein